MSDNSLKKILENIDDKTNQTDDDAYIKKQKEKTDDDAYAKLSELRAARYEQKTKQQENWSHFIMEFIHDWSIFDFVIIILYGCNVLKLNDAIIITLLTTTLAQIIALPIIVCSYLFPKKNNESN